MILRDLHLGDAPGGEGDKPNLPPDSGGDAHRSPIPAIVALAFADMVAAVNPVLPMQRINAEASQIQITFLLRGLNIGDC